MKQSGTRKRKGIIPINVKLLVFRLGLLMLLQFSGRLAKEIEIELNKKYDFYIHKGDKQFYSVNIDHKIEGAAGLIVQIMNPTEQFIYFNVKSENQENKGKVSDRMILSQDFGEWNVTLAESNDKQKFLIEIKCDVPCIYSLVSTYKPKFSEVFPDGVEMVKNEISNEKNEILVKFNTKSKDKKVIFTATFDTFEFFKPEKFEMYAFKVLTGQKSRDKADFQSILIGNNILAIIVPSSDVCENCEILFVLNFPKNAVIKLSAQIQSNEIEFDITASKMDGIVQAGETIFYQIDFNSLTPKEKERFIENDQFKVNFLFSLFPVSGAPEVFLHYGPKMPKVEELQKENASGSLEQDVFALQKEELNRKFGQSSHIYIAIQSKHLSIFSIKLETYSDQRESVRLEVANPIKSFLKKGTVDNYYFSFESNRPRKFDIILKSAYGKPDLFVKYVSSSDSQEIKDISKEVIEENRKVKDYFTKKSSEQDGQFMIRIETDPKQFNNEQPNFKFEKLKYLIAVYGGTYMDNNQKNDDDYYYSIMIQFEEEMPQLFEKVPTYADLKANQQKYFEFKPIGIDSSVELIRFEVSFVLGFAEILAHYDILELKALDTRDRVSEQFLYFDMKNTHQFEFKKSTLPEGKSIQDYNYYLKIKGIKNTKLVIRVYLVRKDELDEMITEVFDKIPIQMTIQPMSPSFFSFNTISDKKLTLTADSNNLIQVAFRDSILKTTYQTDFVDYLQRIIIEPQVQPNQVSSHIGEITNLSDVPIIVNLQLSYKQMKLQINQAFEDILPPNSSRQYEWNFLKDKVPYNFLLKFKKDLESNEKIVIKTKGRYSRVGEKRNEISLNDSFNHELKEKIENYCYAGPDGICQYFVEIFSGEKLLQYHLSFNSENHPQTINSPVMLQLMPFENLIKRRRSFELLLLKKKDYLLSVVTESLNVNVIVDYLHSGSNYYELLIKEGQERSEFTLEEKYYSKQKVSHSINIDQKIFDKLRNDHISVVQLIVVIELEKDSLQLLTKEQAKNELFTVQLKEDLVLDLDEGFGFSSNVKSGQMAYFRAKLPQRTSDPQNPQRLIVRLVDIGDGNSNLYINDGYSNKTITQTNKFDSPNPKGGQIRIINLSKIPPNENYLMIGVLAKMDSKFIIQYTLKKQSFTKIQSDEKLYLSSPSDHDSYFVFQNQQAEEFYVIISFTSGDFESQTVFIQEFNDGYKKESELFDKLKNQVTYNYTLNSFVQSEEKNQKINDKSLKSVYVIGVKSTTQQSSFSLEVKTTEFNGVNKKNIETQSKQDLLGVEEKLTQLNKEVQMTVDETVQTYNFSILEDFLIIIKTQSEIQLNIKVHSKGVSSFEEKQYQFNFKQNESKSEYIFIKHPNKQNQFTFSVDFKTKRGEGQVIIETNIIKYINAAVIVQENVQAKRPFYLGIDSSSLDDQLTSLYVQSPSGFINNDKKLRITIIDSTNSVPVITKPLAVEWSIINLEFETKRTKIYLLEFVNEADTPLDLNILILKGSQHSIPLLIGSTLDTFYSNQFNQMNFGIFTSPEKKVLVQHFNCFSPSQIYLYKKSADLIVSNNQGQLQNRNSSNHDTLILEFQQNQPSLVFFQKRMETKETNQKNSIVQINVFDPFDRIIYDIIKFGDNGKISATISPDNYIQVKFTDLQCIENEECMNDKSFEIESITYSLHISDSEKNLSAIKNCQFTAKDLGSEFELPNLQDKLQVTNMKTIGSKSQQEFRIPLELNEEMLKNNNKLYIGVSATVVVMGQSYRYIYNSAEVNIKFEKPASYLAFYIIGIVILIAIPISFFSIKRFIAKKNKYNKGQK